MENNQTPLLQHVIYAATGATLLDISCITLSTGGKFWRFPGCLIPTASQEDFPGRLQDCFSPNSRVGEPLALPPNAFFSVEYQGVFAQWE